MSGFEPFGYGERWYDRIAAKRRPGLVFAGIGVVVLLIALLD